MRNLTELYNPSLSFWDAAPQLLIIEPFTTFHKNDKSRGKKYTSNIMWAIALLNHPESDIYYVSDKFKQVSRTMMGDEDFDWNKYSKYIDAFIDAALTEGYKSLASQEDVMKRRSAFMKSQEYTLESAAELDRMLANTAKIYDQYFAIKKRLEEEKATAAQKGSKMESLSDSAQI
jgi:hypothetical protein